MSSSRTITLFSERPAQTQRPTSFLVSIVAHAGAISLLSLGILYTPELNDRIVPRQYMVRHLDLHDPRIPVKPSAGKGGYYPGTQSAEKKPTPGQQEGAERAVLRQTATADKGPQTLVQPDITEPVKLTVVTPVPTVVIWTPKKELVKELVAPVLQPAMASLVKPSLNAPNLEINPADLGVSSSNHPTAKMPVFPTTTSPLLIKGPMEVQMTPVLTADTQLQPTPAAIMSLSDLRMPDGRATLPPVNQTAEQTGSGALTPGQASHGTKADQAGGAGNDPAAGVAGGRNGAVGEGSGAKNGTGADAGLTTQQFMLPRDGQFGAVVVGASLQEKYPEMSAVWNDRVAYTVYLHVGLSRSWILQYSLPAASEAASSGNVTRLEAPWPYNIVRPNIPADAINSDALLVHGFVNQAGRFESLSIAFPPDFPEAQFVLDSLKQWQFRPAARDGQPVRVEVLLIIPEERDQAQN
jgi:hypothetical protein